MKNCIDKLYRTTTLDEKSLIQILKSDNDDYLFSAARKRQNEYYGNKIYIRGLIEFTNYCKNNCYYCGIRRGNSNLTRYRLTKNEILMCTDNGYKLGFRTFVLQGGEDMFFKDEDLCDIIYSIKSNHPDCAVTLSVGEKNYDTYKAYKTAGADRYLLRHETANNAHYQKLHPSDMDLKTRKECLFNLKKLGFQTGSGFMVGSPFQTFSDIYYDLMFLKELQPDMIGIGPFLPHSCTPFKEKQKGSLTLTLKLIAILRLMFPYSLIPSTTALASLSGEGRERGILAGANVVMPNLSPQNVRDLYSLYNEKATSGNESAEEIKKLSDSFKKIGYKIVTDIGNVNK